MQLITGGSGFLGLHLTRRLLESGEKVRIFDIAEVDDEEIEDSAEYVKGDVRNYEAIYEACKDVDVVYHTAAVVPIARAGKTYWDVNVLGTKNVLECCLKHRIRKLVYVSSSSVYGIPSKLPVDENTELSPLGDYGKSKYEAEQICQKYKKCGLDISIVRPRTVLGTGRLGILQILFDWFRRGKNFYIIGSGDNLFQLVSAYDLTTACYLMARKDCFQEDFNIGAEEFSTLRQDLEALAHYAGTGSRIISISPNIARPTLKLLDKLRLAPFVDYHYHIIDQDMYFDVTKAKLLLEWNSRDSNIKMLTDTYDWYFENYQQADSRIGTTSRKAVKQGILKLIRYFS